jgi:diaminohydroxyphosphoribosylaminopyrimidine deaminase/5-amino-6-(5-phosphoribosylamino)uracil reductase
MGKVHKNFLHLARKAESLSDHPNYRLGCVIAKKSRLLGIGFNQMKTHPRSKSFTIHAELKAILNSRCDLRGATAYVSRHTTLLPASAKPCRNCEELLIEAGIKRVFFTTPFGIGEMKL